jgi:hypothetical protein
MRSEAAGLGSSDADVIEGLWTEWRCGQCGAPGVRRRVALQAVTTDFGIIVMFCLLGKLNFELFGTTDRGLVV